MDDDTRYFLWESTVEINKLPRVYISGMRHKDFLNKVHVIVDNLTHADAVALRTLMNANTTGEEQ